ncbi:MAG: ABC transporter substrate-binding protein [Chloroflexi bacterium]|nr:ABC transporter substrate-binding protein [Chloroflexota bacterium]
MTRRRALGVGAGALGASAFALACGGGGGKDEGKQAQPSATAAAQQVNEGPKQGGTIRNRFNGTPPLDPIANTTFRAQVMAGYTYSRLVKFKTGAEPAVAMNYEVEPDLASAWEVQPDGSQITFKLNPNAVFHNKAPVNGRNADSEDVKFSFTRFREESKNSNRTVFDPVVDAIETPDPQTVVFKLKKPYGPLLNLFANPQYLWILPRESAGGFDPAKEQIGTGPWVLESLQPDIDVKFKAHRKYFGEGKPYGDAVATAIVADNLTAKSQFQAERLDVEAIQFEDKNEVAGSNPKVKFYTYTPTTTPFMAFQLRGNSPFRDERIRRAFSMAFDRESMLALSFNGQGYFHNMVPAFLGKWWLDPKSSDMGESAKYFQRNIAEAKAMLEAAGASKMEFKFIYTNNAYGERFNQWAESAASMLKDLGVKPAIVVQDYQREYIAANGTFFGNFDGLFFGLQTPLTDPHDFLYNMAHSASKRNHAGVQDTTLDAMIDKQAATLDETTRVKLVRDIQRYMSERMYYAPGFTGPAFTGVQPWVKGYRYSATYGTGTESVAELWLDRA